MPSFRTVRRVPFSPRQMFDLVADVEKYPQFLPLCEELRVKSRAPDGTREIVIAQMTVGYMALRESFTSRVVLDPAGLLVKAAALPGTASGPFSRLHNHWAFVAAGDGCNVDFTIDYELKSFTLQMLVGGLFDRAFRKYAEAFEARAHAIYGATA
ncbi:MAG TPA: SRPBCC family protein [Hyphomicrobiaceae bacterium]|jgi:coenzyme Q-binding protein COQ10|nr:SRPBCC family protein [Hyphomicrobiaceae bacterium]